MENINTCRTCLMLTNDLIDIFQVTINNNNLLDIIMAYTGVHISLNDELPKYVCINCQRMLITITKFKNMCLISDTILRNRKINENDSIIEYLQQSRLNQLENIYQYIHFDENFDLKKEHIDECKQEIVSDNESEYISKSSPLHFIEENKSNKKTRKKNVRRSIRCKQKNLDLKESFEYKLENDLKIELVSSNDSSSPLLLNDDINSSVSDNIPPPKNKKRIRKSTRLNNKPNNEIFENVCVRKNNRTFQNAEDNFKSEDLENNYGSQSSIKKLDKRVQGGIKNKKELRICYICGKMTLQLSEHLITHRNIRDWKCDKCEKMFSNRAALRKHQAVHNPCNVHCEKCGRTFPRKHSLSRHIRTVHYPTKSFECSVCSKRCENAYNLKVHQMIHSGEKRYKCKHCPEQFTCKIKYREHDINAHNVQPSKLYKCDKCDQTFVYNFQLLAHQKKTDHKSIDSISESSDHGTFHCTDFDDKIKLEK